jgi:hypothetical protein
VEQVGKNSWSAVELGERRVLPALPDTDADVGEIRWDRWERHLVVTHIDPSCDTCGYAGPLAMAKGMTLYQDPPRRKLLQRSAIAKGQRAVGGPLVTPPPRWVYTHFATRCQACDEMLVWIISGQRPRCTECAAVSPKELAGRKAQCPACLAEADHVVPGGSSRFSTWIEVAYNPPRTEKVPVAAPDKAPQEETLF